MKEDFWRNDGEFTVRHVESDATRDDPASLELSGEPRVGDRDPGVTGIQVRLHQESARNQCY